MDNAMLNIKNISRLRITTSLLLITVFLLLSVFTSICFAEQVQDPSVVTSIAERFSTKASAWAKHLEGVALTIFKYLLTINIALFGFKAALDVATGRAHLWTILGEFAMMMVFAGIFYGIITHYKEWSDLLIKAFGTIARDLGAPNLKMPFFQVGINIAGRTWDAVEALSPKTWVLLIAGCVLLIAYALMAAQILLVKCESYIVMNAGIFILGFAGLNQTKEYAINFLRYALSVAVKLFVLQLLVGMSMSFVDDFLKTPIDLENIAIVLGASVVMLALVRSIPDICSGIIHGQHTNSGAGLASSFAAVAAGTAAVAGAAVGIAGSAANVGSTIKESIGAAKDAGHSGMSAVGRGLAGAMGAMGQTAMDGIKNVGQSGGSFGRNMASHAATNRTEQAFQRDQEKAQHQEVVKQMSGQK